MVNLVKLVLHREDSDEAELSVLHDGVAAVGWSYVGNLAGLSRKEIKSRLRRGYSKYRTKRNPYRAADERMGYQTGLRTRS